MVQVWEGRRWVRHGRVQWHPLGLGVRRVLGRHRDTLGYGAGVGGARVRAGGVRREALGFGNKAAKKTIIRIFC